MATINNVQSSTTNTLSYTPASVANSVLIVCVASEDVSNDNPITGVDFGGTALTNAAIGISTVVANANDAGIWYLVSPGISAQTITLSGGESGRRGIVAFTAGGIDQSTVVDVSQNPSVAESNPPHSIATSATTTVSDCLIVSCFSGSVGLNALGLTGGTIQADIKPGGTLDLGCGTSDQLSAGTYLHTWTEPSAFTNQRNVACSVAFIGASGGTTVTLSPFGSTNTFGVTSVEPQPVIGPLTTVDSTNGFDITSVERQELIELSPIDSVNDLPSPTISMPQMITLDPIDSINQFGIAGIDGGLILRQSSIMSGSIRAGSFFPSRTVSIQ